MVRRENENFRFSCFFIYYFSLWDFGFSSLPLSSSQLSPLPTPRVSKLTKSSTSRLYASWYNIRNAVYFLFYYFVTAVVRFHRLKNETNETKIKNN